MWVCSTGDGSTSVGLAGTATAGRSSNKGVAVTAAGVDSTLESAGAATTGSVTTSLVGSTLAGATTTGCVASTAGAADATFFPGAATLVDSIAAGCPQFVQKLDSGSILVPHDVQKGSGEAVGAAGSISSGTAAVTAEAA